MSAIRWGREGFATADLPERDFRKDPCREKGQKTTKFGSVERGSQEKAKTCPSKIAKEEAERKEW